MEQVREIVINVCFGGFSLSYEAVMEYARLSGKKICAYTDDYKQWNPSMGKKPFLMHYAEIDKPQVTSEELNAHYFSDRDIERDDKFLVQIVKKLGRRANGECADLEVVEIPADVKWVIDEYDGSESVEEEHRSWR